MGDDDPAQLVNDRIPAPLSQSSIENLNTMSHHTASLVDGGSAMSDLFATPFDSNQTFGSNLPFGGEQAFSSNTGFAMNAFNDISMQDATLPNDSVDEITCSDTLPHFDEGFADAMDVTADHVGSNTIHHANQAGGALGDGTQPYAWPTLAAGPRPTSSECDSGSVGANSFDGFDGDHTANDLQYQNLSKHGYTSYAHIVPGPGWFAQLHYADVPESQEATVVSSSVEAKDEKEQDGDDFVSALQHGSSEDEDSDYEDDRPAKRAKLNKDGIPRKPRQPRPKLLKWDDNDWKLVALGVVWACGENSVRIPFAQAAQLVGENCTAGALQQAILKLRAKMIAEGFKIPPLKMAWTPKKKKKQHSSAATSKANSGATQDSASTTRAISRRRRTTRSTNLQSQSMVAVLNRAYMEEDRRLLPFPYTGSNAALKDDSHAVPVHDTITNTAQALNVEPHIIRGDLSQNTVHLDTVRGLELLVRNIPNGAQTFDNAMVESNSSRGRRNRRAQIVDDIPMNFPTSTDPIGLGIDAHDGVKQDFFAPSCSQQGQFGHESLLRDFNSDFQSAPVSQDGTSDQGLHSYTFNDSFQAGILQDQMSAINAGDSQAGQWNYREINRGIRSRSDHARTVGLDSHLSSTGSPKPRNYTTPGHPLAPNNDFLSAAPDIKPAAGEAVSMPGDGPVPLGVRWALGPDEQPDGPSQYPNFPYGYALNEINGGNNNHLQNLGLSYGIAVEDFRQMMNTSANYVGQV